LRVLPRGHSWRVVGAQGSHLSCHSGSLWITHDGDLKDWIFEAGQTHDVRSAAPMIVYALDDACAELVR
jgi:hypothetical protein